MAQPWTGSSSVPGLSQQYQKKTLASIAALNGKRIAHTNGNGWYFDVTLQNVAGSVNIASPPGFSAASPNGFTIGAPLSGSWSFGLSAVAHGDGAACCTPVGKNWFSVKGDLPFSLRISNLRLTASAAVNAADPARPTLLSGQVAVKADVGGSGIFSAVPVNLTATAAGGKITLSTRLTNLSLSFGGISARLTADFALTLLPSQDSVEAQIGKTLDLSAAFQKATVSLQGQLAVKLPQPVGNKTSSFGLTFPVDLPSTRALSDALRLLQPPLPRRWPPPGAPDRPDAHAQASSAAAADFTGVRDTLENGIVAHLPYGAVLSIDYPNAVRKPNATYSYGLEADSTIWTGHYLAAEAFRYAATASPEAAARIRTLLGGIQRDFDVTRDAAVVNGKLTPVSSSYAGIFARSTLPSNDPHGYTDGALDKRESCYYEHPTGGWRGVGSRTYPTLAAVLRAGLKSKSKSKIRTPPTPVITAAEPILYGFGCGSRGETDHPVSRDQYVGLFMGLAYAYSLAPLPDVRAQAQALIDQALDFLLRNNWNAPLPPEGTITTTFIGDIDTQLALLRMGAAVDPARFGSAYQKAAAASELAWIPAWFSTIDPLVSYFKFNLGHAALGPAIFFEPDPTLRANYLRAYRLLAAASVTHRNAYFDLVDILDGVSAASSPSASNPSISLGDEVKSDLADWITRWRYVKGSNGMPRNATSPAAAAYLAQLWRGSSSSDDVKLYTDTNGSSSWSVSYPLPVWARTGNGTDFVWQRSPFGSGVDPPSSKRTARAEITGTSYTCSTTPPSAAQIMACSADATREGPGIDYLLPYWLAVYLNVLPSA